MGLVEFLEGSGRDLAWIRWIQAKPDSLLSLPSRYLSEDRSVRKGVGHGMFHQSQDGAQGRGDGCRRGYFRGSDLPPP